MEIYHPVEPSQRQKDSKDVTIAAVVEALAKQVTAIEEQVAMIAGPSQTHEKRRVQKELLQSCEKLPQPRPSTLPSSSSHNLNDVVSAVARQATVAGRPVAAMRG